MVRHTLFVIYDGDEWRERLERHVRLEVRVRNVRIGQHLSHVRHIRHERQETTEGQEKHGRHMRWMSC